MGGKSIVQQVYDQAKKAKSLSRVIVATDHEEIFRNIRSFGGEVCMTRKDHSASTGHCSEALTSQYDNFNYVINIPGKEPFITPEQIDC